MTGSEELVVDYCVNHGSQAAGGVCALCVADYGTSGTEHVERRAFLSLSEIEPLVEALKKLREALWVCVRDGNIPHMEWVTFVETTLAQAPTHTQHRCEEGV